MTELDESERQRESERRRSRHSRIRRAKQILRPLPRRATLHKWPVLKWFAKSTRKMPYLWSFRVREVSIALYVGCVIAFLPILGIQIPLAFAAALVLRGNLPIFIGVQMITNLATAGFIYTTTTLLGRYLADLWGLHQVHNKVGRIAFDATLGGIFVGILVACILDLTYRIMASRARSRSIPVSKIIRK